MIGKQLRHGAAFVRGSVQTLSYIRTASVRASADPTRVLARPCDAHNHSSSVELHVKITGVECVFGNESPARLDIIAHEH